jgi:hypothetical protein
MLSFTNLYDSQGHFDESPTHRAARATQAKLPQCQMGVLYEHRSIPNVQKKGIINSKDTQSRMMRILTKHRQELIQ